MSKLTASQASSHTPETVEVAIIGAGPAGAIAASLLQRQGKSVRVLEKQHFPRFSIGESLLPCCMQFLEEAGMLEAVNGAGFQFKNGAAFRRDGQTTQFNFTDKFTPGPGTTFQVQRAGFDKLLADTAQSQGVEIRYGETVEQIDLDGTPTLTVRNEQGQSYRLEAQYVLDASGFGRVLPKLLGLERPSNLSPRMAIFTHIEDKIDAVDFDRNKILISVHPQQKDIWYWLIPFSNGRCSLGVVAEPQLLAHLEGSLEEKLLAIVKEDPELKALLANASLVQECGTLQGYSVNVTQLATDKFALLGNAGEFLDPVFSSGVTIAMQSASMAVKCVLKQLDGQAVDWQAEYAAPLMQGVDTFRTYVQAWYDGSFQEVIFHPDPNPKIKQMICSILAGYAWDTNNPFVSESSRRLNTVVEICRQSQAEAAEAS
ncbi:NAD(P)/FAD-dependent oxidoreductase [Shewanella salipaludis]|uniref:FAD-dependent oxidoreductase n=1 Tax=Shewanella salipaludis TaxID=2723052 RepID=A0A972FUA3_9GAMM|nr:tryptophan 7-halogenase [Shewanella salipaludis]NMH66303.1 FAD-dependent oxidoreductase [Shewanella salipaludis]